MSKVFSVRIKEPELIQFIESKKEKEFKTENTIIKEMIVASYQSEKLNASK